MSRQNTSAWYAFGKRRIKATLSSTTGTISHMQFCAY
jgi:hypothetical protein